MPLSPEAEYQIQRAARRLAERERHREALRRAAHAAAEYLVDELGARRVWRFGSLERAWFHASSDLDLAVEGLDPDVVGRAWDHLRHTLEVELDLVCYEVADPGLQRKILETGEVLRVA